MFDETVLIRAADLWQPEDAGAVLRLLDRYAADPMGGGYPLNIEARGCLVPALRAMPGALVLLAWASEKPVGVAVCFVGFFNVRSRGLFNVHDLAVLPDWRGRGIGGRLLGAVEIEARARGYCKVTFEVRADNAVALALYRRRGYGVDVSAGGPAQDIFLERRLRD